jgi:hypothetical protein
MWRVDLYVLARTWLAELSPDPAGPLFPTQPRPGERGWLEWLESRLDPRWRAGEWDSQTLLFTGDLASAQPLDPTMVKMLLARLGDAVSLRAADPQAVCESRGLQYNSAVRGLFRCTVPGCEGDLHCNGLCFRHEHIWRKKGTSEPARRQPAADAHTLCGRPVPGCVDRQFQQGHLPEVIGERVDAAVPGTGSCACRPNWISGCSPARCCVHARPAGTSRRPAWRGRSRNGP